MNFFNILGKPHKQERGVIQCAFGLLSGTCIIAYLPSVPTVAIVSTFMAVAILKFVQPKVFYFAVGLSLGLVAAKCTSDHRFSWQLDEKLISTKVDIIGTVQGISQNNVYTVQVHKICKGTFCQTPHENFSLYWKDAPKSIRPLDTVTLLGTVKPPHSLMNPGGFDTERVDHIGRIRARGNVYKGSYTPTHTRSIDGLRLDIKNTIQKTFSHLHHTPVLIGLILGLSGDIDPTLKETLQNTGTSHLMAISGLHIGLVAFWSFMLAFYGLRPFCLVQNWSSPTVALFFSATVSMAYAALAGFSLPTQRALIMLLVGYLALLTHRRPDPWNTFAVALLAVLIWDPLSPIQSGFWLSFGAIFALVWYFHFRKKPTRLQNLFGAQFAVFAFLSPLSLYLFAGTSIISPLANIFAIGWVSFVTVPLTFLAFLALPFAESTNILWYLADTSVSFLIMVLELCTKIPGGFHTHPEIPIVWVVCAVIGTIVLLMPTKWWRTPIGILAWIPMLIFPYMPKPNGVFTVHMLDVGQGLSVAVHTKNHHVLFDTGPIGSAQKVLVPYLRAQNVHALDMVVVSHGDSDHAGGLWDLYQKIPIGNIVSGEPHRLLVDANYCKAGQTWTFDDVHFEMLHPTGTVKKSNDTSCVLRVSNAHHSVLLTGDITKTTENQSLFPKSDIVFAPHHGSKSSSTQQFINQTQPSWVLISSGWYNPYKHPHAPVIERYTAAGAHILNTTQTGAVLLTIGKSVQVESYRLANERVWHHS